MVTKNGQFEPARPDAPEVGSAATTHPAAAPAAQAPEAAVAVAIEAILPAPFSPGFAGETALRGGAKPEVPEQPRSAASASGEGALSASLSTLPRPPQGFAEPHDSGPRTQDPGPFPSDRDRALLAQLFTDPEAIDPFEYAAWVKRPEIQEALAARDELKERKAALRSATRAEKAMDRLAAVLDTCHRLAPSSDSLQVSHSATQHAGAPDSDPCRGDLAPSGDSLPSSSPSTKHAGADRPAPSALAALMEMRRAATVLIRVTRPPSRATDHAALRTSTTPFRSYRGAVGASRNGSIDCSCRRHPRRNAPDAEAEREDRRSRHATGDPGPASEGSGPTTPRPHQRDDAPQSGSSSGQSPVASRQSPPREPCSRVPGHADLITRFLETAGSADWPKCTWHLSSHRRAEFRGTDIFPWLESWTAPFRNATVELGRTIYFDRYDAAQTSVTLRPTDRGTALRGGEGGEAATGQKPGATDHCSPITDHCVLAIHAVLERDNYLKPNSWRIDDITIEPADVTSVPRSSPGFDGDGRGSGPSSPVAVGHAGSPPILPASGEVAEQPRPAASARPEGASSTSCSTPPHAPQAPAAADISTFHPPLSTLPASPPAPAASPQPHHVPETAVRIQLDALRSNDSPEPGSGIGTVYAFSAADDTGQPVPWPKFGADFQKRLASALVNHAGATTTPVSRSPSTPPMPHNLPYADRAKYRAPLETAVIRADVVPRPVPRPSGFGDGRAPATSPPI